MFTIAVLNQKGGVGKTTTVANLGAAVARRGCDVCLIDLDPQAHLTLHFGIEPGQSDLSIYDVLTGQAQLPDARRQVRETLWLVPSEIDLAGAEIELAATVGREQILRDCLADQPIRHELALIDCPPSLGLLTLNALAAADEVFIPLQPHFLALQGLGKLLETVRLVQRRINPRLRVGGIILCMYETGTRLAAEVVADLQQFFEGARGTDCPWAQTRIFETLIRRNVKLAECPSHGKTIFEYDASSRGAADYGELAEEFLRYWPGLVGPTGEAAAQGADAGEHAGAPAGEDEHPEPPPPMQPQDEVEAQGTWQAEPAAATEPIAPAEPTVPAPPEPAPSAEPAPPAPETTDTASPPPEAPSPPPADRPVQDEPTDGAVTR